mmetsp:Transcript_41719/g.37131  ORF Transcript_41719/g.37131 Transcript_41719/m.37131 type:complete len:138 (-) Transcript_41719:708-1121(-)
MQSNISLNSLSPKQLIDLGYYSKARDVLQCELDSYLNAFGHSHPQCSEVAELFSQIGFVLVLEERIDEALEAYSKSYRMFLKLKGSDHEKTVTQLKNLNECQERSTPAQHCNSMKKSILCVGPKPTHSRKKKSLSFL